MNLSIFSNVFVLIYKFFNNHNTFQKKSGLSWGAGWQGGPGWLGGPGGPGWLGGPGFSNYVICR